GRRSGSRKPRAPRTEAIQFRFQSRRGSRHSAREETRTMSSLRHPHLDLWTRDEHGGYVAEMNDHKLAVRWRPASEGTRRGFFFEATPPNGEKHVDAIIHEEMEVAMSHAEAFAEGDPKKSEPN